MTDPSAVDILRSWLARYDANDKAAAHGRPIAWDDNGQVLVTSHNFDNVIPPMDVDEVEAVRALLDGHSDDFTWEQWAVQIKFPGGVTMVDHDTEDEARSHLRQLLSKPIEGRRVEVVRRVNVQGAWRAVHDEDDDDKQDGCDDD